MTIAQIGSLTAGGTVTVRGRFAAVDAVDVDVGVDVTAADIFLPSVGTRGARKLVILIASKFIQSNHSETIVRHSDCGGGAARARARSTSTSAPATVPSTFSSCESSSSSRLLL
jgi:hypothetical protein